MAKWLHLQKSHSYDDPAKDKEQSDYKQTYLDRAKLEVFSTVIVHNNHIVIANVQLFAMRLGVLLSAGHQSGDMEDH